MYDPLVAPKIKKYFFNLEEGREYISDLQNNIQIYSPHFISVEQNTIE